MIEQRLAHWTNEHTHTHSVVNERWDEMRKCAYWISKRTCCFVILQGEVVRRMYFFFYIHLTHAECKSRTDVRMRQRNRVDTTKSSGWFLCFALNEICRFEQCSHGSISASANGSTMVITFKNTYRMNWLSVALYPFHSISLICSVIELFIFCDTLSFYECVIWSDERSKNTRIIIYYCDSVKF